MIGDKAANATHEARFLGKALRLLYTPLLPQQPSATELPHILFVSSSLAQRLLHRLFAKSQEKTLPQVPQAHDCTDGQVGSRS